MNGNTPTPGYGALLALIIVMAASAWLGELARRAVRRGTFVKGFFLGNRALGAWALALTSTVQSGGTFMGFPALVYTYGWVGSLFMTLGGLPFPLFIMLAQLRMRGRIDPQVYVFLGLIALTTLLLLLGRPGPGSFSFDSLSQDLFNVISVLTTTGYAAGDYPLWGGLAIPVFFLLTGISWIVGLTVRS